MDTQLSAVEAMAAMGHDSGQNAPQEPAAGPAANGWKTGGYLEKMPKDPWGNPYQFLSPGVKGEVDLISLGADGQPGGSGDDADIGSWEL